MKSSGITANGRTYAIMITACEKMENLEYAFYLYNEMKSSMSEDVERRDKASGQSTFS
jgi:pentatricopeptide repeat protein